MRSKAMLSHGLVSKGVLFVSAPARAACDEIIHRNAVRSYCYTDPLLGQKDEPAAEALARHPGEDGIPY